MVLQGWQIEDNGTRAGREPAIAKVQFEATNLLSG